jgi:hypothetical protein
MYPVPAGRSSHSAVAAAAAVTVAANKRTRATRRKMMAPHRTAATVLLAVAQLASAYVVPEGKSSAPISAKMFALGNDHY